MKTPKEILRKVCNYVPDLDELNDNDDITVEEALEAMQEYADQFKPNLKELRKKFFKECTYKVGNLHQHELVPHDLFEWFKNQLNK